jgi:hypothetical protein
VFSIDVTYNAGSANEKQGRTGFAHLFEHMMFEGSQNIGKGEHMFLVQNYGGSILVVVGDAKQIRDAVAKYGETEVFDTEGKAVPAKAEAAPAAAPTK